MMSVTSFKTPVLYLCTSDISTIFLSNDNSDSLWYSHCSRDIKCLVLFVTVGCTFRWIKCNYPGDILVIKCWNSALITICVDFSSWHFKQHMKEPTDTFIWILQLCTWHSFALRSFSCITAWKVICQFSLLAWNVAVQHASLNPANCIYNFQWQSVTVEHFDLCWHLASSQTSARLCNVYKPLPRPQASIHSWAAGVLLYSMKILSTLISHWYAHNV